MREPASLQEWALLSWQGPVEQPTTVTAGSPSPVTGGNWEGWGPLRIRAPRSEQLCGPTLT